MQGWCRSLCLAFRRCDLGVLLSFGALRLAGMIHVTDAHYDTHDR